MIYLAGSVLFSAFLTIAFKICKRLGIDTFQAIVFNYLTCVITGVMMIRESLQVSEILHQPWLPWALLLGCCFIIFFNLTALTVRTSGLAVAAVATKLSLVIPFLFSLYLYRDASGPLKIAGVCLAVVSVVLTCIPREKQKEKSLSLLWLLLPLAVFLGTGLQDTAIKYAQHSFLASSSPDSFLITCFAVAFTIGGIGLVQKFISKGSSFQVKALVAGICIGIPNYFSIWCLIMVLKQFPDHSSVIIPINNIGIVFVNAVAALLVFREKLSKLNIAGIILAMISIYLITSDLS